MCMCVVAVVLYNYFTENEVTIIDSILGKLL